MQVDLPTPHWSTDLSWAAHVQAWVDAELENLGLARTGPFEVEKARPWSIVMSVRTDQGLVWFKENCPGQRHEAALVDALNSLVPGRVVEALAVDAERGWLLAPDHGPTRRTLGLDGDPDAWAELLVEYAGIQRELAPHASSLIESGTARMGSKEAPAYLADQIETRAAYPESDPGRLDPQHADRLRNLLPEITRSAELVTSSGLPDTLDHNDLHTNNAFAARSRDGHLVFFDFGDAVIGNPLCTLLIPLNILFNESGLAPGESRVDRIVDAALEVWSDITSVRELRTIVPAAMRLGRLNRSESWRRVIQTADADADAVGEFGDAPVAWLDTLAADDRA